MPDVQSQGSIEQGGVGDYLGQVYEAMNGFSPLLTVELGKDTFRRRVLHQLVETDAFQPGWRSCFGTRRLESTS